MRIGILGAGKMAEALGGQWVRAGHDIMVGARDLTKATALADQLSGNAGQVRAGTLTEAAAHGDVVLLAVSADAALDVIRAVTSDEGRLAGTVVVDCTVPFVPDRFTLATAGGPALVERIATAVPDAHVVKAFNICAAEVYRMTPPAFDGVPLAVPVCGADSTAVETVAELVRDLNCTPMPAGDLERAALSEATSVFIVGLWFGGADAATAVPSLAHAFGT